MRRVFTKLLFAITTTSALAVSPRYDATFDASALVTSQKKRLEMAQAASQDFGFTFSNLQSAFAGTETVVWYYTDPDYTWQVAVTGSIEDADTALVEVTPSYSNTNTVDAGAFPWRLEITDTGGEVLATACGSLVIPRNPLAGDQPVLVTTTAINTSDYTVTGTWPVSSIPTLTAYETAATNGQGTSGQVLSTDGSGGNYWSNAGNGDISSVTVAGGLLSGGGTSGDVTITLNTNAINSAESDPIWSSNALASNNGASLTNIPASSVKFTPAGSIAATDVQAAIEEVDGEKLALAGGTMTGDIVTGINNVSGQRFGLSAGDGSSGSAWHAFGSSAGFGASGDSWHAFGSNAGFGASGDSWHAFGSNAGFGASGDSWHAFGEGAGLAASGTSWHAFGNGAGRSSITTNSHFFGKLAGYNARGSNRGYWDVYASTPFSYGPDGSTNDTIFLDSDGHLYLGGGAGRAENPSAGVTLRGAAKVANVADEATEVVNYQRLLSMSPTTLVSSASVEIPDEYRSAYYLTTTNAVTLSVANARTLPWDLVVYGTNSVTLDTGMTLLNAATLTGTNVFSAIPGVSSDTWTLLQYSVE